ncbi:DUF4231 domain-containing protein [Nonomuraea rubra]|uniref:DUF4231 domain-containing protein n=1 Tax=Nonomuraea rubra TaxID=46180 RepID=UPI0033DB882B
MSNPENVEQGPLERLLEHNTEIIEAQDAVRTRKIQRRSLIAFGVISCIATLTIFVATVLTWRKVDLGQINGVAIPLTLLCIAIFVALAIQESERPANQKTSVRRLQLELELVEEARRLHASQLSLSLYQRQYAYKEDIPRELGQLRREAKYYRRIHNAFQSLIIIGSLGTTTAASIAETPPPLKWVTVGLSFAVGLSAGFTGYFKYRERSFYLQQTADSIEQHMAAFDLGISPYTHEDEKHNLRKLANEVELLRVEQRKRQQQLDQPHEGREGTV